MLHYYLGVKAPQDRYVTKMYKKLQNSEWDIKKH